MKNEIDILVADIQPIVRSGLRYLSAQHPNLKIVAEISSGKIALERIRAMRPDIVILDFELSELDGLALAGVLQAEKLNTALIFLTMRQDADSLHRALEAGALGYVLKHSETNDILDAIRAVAAGDYYISSALSNTLVIKHRKTHQFRSETKHLAVLSPTERRVLELLASYKTSREIANELNISPRTVQTHRTNICKKMELHGNYALMKFALSYLGEI